MKKYTLPLPSIRQSAVVGLAAAMTFSLVAVGASAATAKLNGACVKAGATAKSGGQTLVCAKSGSKAVWVLSAASTSTSTTIAATAAPAPSTATTAPAAAAAAPVTSAPVGPAPADMDPNGILKVGVSIDLPGGTSFDPQRSVVNADEPWILNIYGALMRPTEDGGFEPWLAKSVDIVDPKTIKVTLNPGIVFSDGSPYDAAAVQAGMMRTLNTPFPAAKSGQNSLFKELAGITVDGPLALTFKLQTPVAGEFLAVFAGREGAVPSSKAVAAGVDLNKTPIGAGPFLLADYKPVQVISLRKSPTFFQKDRWRLAGFDFVNAPTPAVGVSGLLAGTVQFALVDPADAGKVESGGRYTVDANYTDYSYIVMDFCSSKPPFNDIRVRQAVQAALDKSQINSFFLRGRGKPGYGFWPENSPNFNNKLKTTTAQDVDKAKRLIKDAGASGATFDLAYPSQVNYVALSELIQSQLDPIGLKVNITPLRDIVTDFIIAQKPGAMIVPGSRSGVDKVNKLFQPGNQQVLCGQPRTDISALAEQVAGLKPGDPKAIDLWNQIDQINADNAYTVFVVNQPIIYAYNKNEVGGSPAFALAKGISYQAFESVYIKK